MGLLDGLGSLGFGDTEKISFYMIKLLSALSALILSSSVLSEAIRRGF